MASEKKTEQKAEQKMETVFVPRGMANSGNSLFISVNGVNWLLPEGQKHEVPDYVAEEFHRIQAAEEKAYQVSGALQAK